MARNILVITGSPRPRGNTNTLAEAFIGGAEENGNRITKVHVGGKTIHGCINCDFSRTHPGECSQRDDMQEILPLFYQNDLVVFSTPVYYFGLTSQLKAMIDRFYPSQFKPFAIRDAVFMSVMTDTDPETMLPSVLNFRGICNYLKWNILDMIVGGGITDPGDIDGDEILERAVALGRSIR